MIKRKGTTKGDKMTAATKNRKIQSKKQKTRNKNQESKSCFGHPIARSGFFCCGAVGRSRLPNLQKIQEDCA